MGLFRCDCPGKQGRNNAADGGVVYVVMDGTRETRLFSARLDEDAYIEFIGTEAESSLPPGSGTGETEHSHTTTM